MGSGGLNSSCQVCVSINHFARQSLCPLSHLPSHLSRALALMVIKPVVVVKWLEVLFSLL
ncbi:rCG31171 [Rattus norvegicus]|uniref:RCG31171 n=1 Tax=Rattus norvegicus TaxID=10116 RepID=A6ITN3_RAT|nr:rCG31171 [Rattus norvegicus]